ncbi:HipA family kinase [Jiangella anatolica]|uniref:Aminotransferase class I and II n=1 Tax=Jiangella anatolica TaxID=2670374 RepID=A0A2W2C0L8_9ACTN|nr:HipA family kinase [Jiangella anatolica]PZF81859.1 aminotransferase class I and II [Jiangella anatolica]
MVDVPAVTTYTGLPLVRAVRYVEPLREGGSLPGLVEGDDLGTYVVKFRGAGQGPKSLVAEIVVGELSRRLDIRVPDLVLVDLDEAIARREPDPEIQALLLASVGVNLGMDFLPRSLGYDGHGRRADATDAAKVLWLDALTVNVDRSWRNPNLLTWHGQLWAIDHGAALLFQHTWPGVEAFAARPYPIDDHVLAFAADRLPAVDAELAPLVTPSALAQILALVPDDWLPDLPGHPDADAVRAVYADYLAARVAASSAWLPAAAA